MSDTSQTRNSRNTPSTANGQVETEITSAGTGRTAAVRPRCARSCEALGGDPQQTPVIARLNNRTTVLEDIPATTIPNGGEFMNWKKLLTTALLWFIIVPTPHGYLTTRHAFNSETDCQTFLDTIGSNVDDSLNQKLAKALSKNSLNTKLMSSLFGQTKCVEQ